MAKKKLKCACSCCYRLILQNTVSIISQENRYFNIMHTMTFHSISLHMKSLCAQFGNSEQSNTVFYPFFAFVFLYPSLPLPLPERPVLHSKTSQDCIDIMLAELCKAGVAANIVQSSAIIALISKWVPTSLQNQLFVRQHFLFTSILTEFSSGRPNVLAFYVFNYCNARTVKC